LFCRTCISRLADAGPGDHWIVQEFKKDLLAVLLTFKVEFDRSYLAKDLLRPILDLVFKDLEESTERVEYNLMKTFFC
jgi:hypothetical protein